MGKNNFKKINKKGWFWVDNSLLGYLNTIYGTYDNNNCRESLVIKREWNHCDRKKWDSWYYSYSFNIVPQFGEPTQGKQHIVVHYR